MNISQRKINWNLSLTEIDMSAVRDAVPKDRGELGIAEDAFVVGMIGTVVASKSTRCIHQGCKVDK